MALQDVYCRLGDCQHLTNTRSGDPLVMCGAKQDFVLGIRINIYFEYICIYTAVKKIENEIKSKIKNTLFKHWGAQKLVNCTFTVFRGWFYIQTTICFASVGS